jgi:hypothetical protein
MCVFMCTCAWEGEERSRGGGGIPCSKKVKVTGEIYRLQGELGIIESYC